MAIPAPVPPDDFDARLRFLFQSTESLHASLQELHATISAQNEAQKERDRLIDNRFDKLLTIVEGHERRLNNIEDPPA